MPIMPASEPSYAVVAEVCDIVARPGDFNGKVVEVSGSFFTDWHHAMLIMGQPCEMGIMFGGDRAALGEPWAAIEATEEWPVQPEIRLTVVERFRWDPGATGMFPRKYVVMVERIVSLDIQTP